MKDSKYEEALERAKQGMPIDEVFPELKESEDERTLNEIIAFIEHAIHRGGGIPIPEEKEDRWIAYLEKQKEQKPAEWSVEDETAYGDLIWCIEQAKKSAKDENDMGNIWFAENWVKKRIKSLRPQPHWKPSKEQLNALHAFVGMIHPDARYDAVLSLLNDLQKLL